MTCQLCSRLLQCNLQQDLYKPDSNRLRRNLSGIINFAKFREEKLVPYTDMQESVEHLLEETAGLEELNMRLVITIVLCDTLYFCHSACHSCIKATSPLSTIPN